MCSCNLEPTAAAIESGAVSCMSGSGYVQTETHCLVCARVGLAGSLLGVLSAPGASQCSPCTHLQCLPARGQAHFTWSGTKTASYRSMWLARTKRGYATCTEDPAMNIRVSASVDTNLGPLKYECNLRPTDAELWKTWRVYTIELHYSAELGPAVGLQSLQRSICS